MLCAVFAVIAGLLVLHGSDDQSNHVTVQGQRVALTREQSYGHRLFAEHCAACHQLAASRSIGQVGPDLDAVHPTDAQVINTIVNGATGSYGDMPSGLATGPALYAVASYVSRVATPAAFHP